MLLHSGGKTTLIRFLKGGLRISFQAFGGVVTGYFPTGCIYNSLKIPGRLFVEVIHDQHAKYILNCLT